jgi:hypothetical protein
MRGLEIRLYSQIRASYWMTFPLTIVNFNHFFIQPAPDLYKYEKEKLLTY